MLHQTTPRPPNQASRLRRPRATIATSGVLAALGLTLALSACGVLGGGTMNIGNVHFDKPLPIPPLAQSHPDATGEKIFDLQRQPLIRPHRHRRRPAAGVVS